MPTKKRKKAGQKMRTLASKTLSGKHASDVKGGYLAKGAHFNEVVLAMRRSDDSAKK